MSAAVARLYARLAAPMAGLSTSRRRFADFYDGWVLESAGAGGPREAGGPMEAGGPAASAAPALPAGFLHAVVSARAACLGCSPAPDAARTQDAIRLAVAALGDPAAALGLLGAALGAGLFDPSDPGQAPAFRKSASAGLLAALAEGSARATLQAQVSHEKLTDDDDFWTDMGHLLPAILFGRRRLCVVEALPDTGPKSFGTGFLVGPSAVLTNLHVVQPVLADPAGGTLLCKFDYSETTARKHAQASRYAAAEDWLIAKGALGDAAQAEALGDYWWNSRSQRAAFAEAVAATPDFALIRLEGAPGLQRGWYDLADAQARAAQAGLEPVGVWALHHPGMNDQTITRGVVRLPSAGAPPARLFHSASTAKGSSGGLILDQDGVPSALHYLGVEASVKDPAQENDAINLAIPLAHIAGHLAEQGLLESLAQPAPLRPFRGCLDGRRPVFGRQGFLADLEALWSGPKRILRVHVTPAARAQTQPGKSFSAEILRALFRGPEHHHILFRAGDLKADARRVTEAAIGSFAEDFLPELPAFPGKTTPEYASALVAVFARAIRAKLGNQHVWVILDDLDRHDLSDASGREVLAALYAQVKALPNLRVMLIGLGEEVAIAGMAAEDYIASAVSPQTITDLRAHLGNWLMERGLRDAAVGDAGVAILSDVLLSAAGEAAPLAGLAQVVSDHVAGPLEARLGPAVPPALPPEGTP